MIDWSTIEPLTPAELAGLDFAQLSEDPLVVRIMALLARAHLSDLVYGGDPSVVDPSGWAKSTLPAVATLIARDLVGGLSDEDRFRLARAASELRSEYPGDADLAVLVRVVAPLVADVDLEDEAAWERWPR